jgi:ethanolamine ammonia-lyase small subunit
MLIENPWTKLRELTSARIAIGRAGNSLPTRELLSFQLAHARAKDAVWHPLDEALFADLQPVVLHSRASDRLTYLRRPDLGRSLDAASKETLNRGDYDAALVLVDGLSAEALERHGREFVQALGERLSAWKLAPLTLVRQGRVAVGDEVGELLGAAMAVVIVGERPGLGSPDSLGVYVTWAPRVGRTDAERFCVSNIRTDGLIPEVAAERVASLMMIARARQITGVVRGTGSIGST